MDKLSLKDLSIVSILPLIYISDRFETALIAGLVLSVVSFILKGFSVGFDRFLDEKTSLYGKLIVAAMIVSIASLVLQAFLTLPETFLVYLALILLNVELLHQKGKEADFKGHGKMLIMSFGLLLVIGLFREVIGTGSFGMTSFGLESISLFQSEYALSFLNQAAGGFILSGIIFGIFQSISFKKKVGESDAL